MITKLGEILDDDLVAMSSGGGGFSDEPVAKFEEGQIYEAGDNVLHNAGDGRKMYVYTSSDSTPQEKFDPSKWEVVSTERELKFINERIDKLTEQVNKTMPDNVEKQTSENIVNHKEWNVGGIGVNPESPDTLELGEITVNMGDVGPAKVPASQLTLPEAPVFGEYSDVIAVIQTDRFPDGVEDYQQNKYRYEYGYRTFRVATHNPELMMTKLLESSSLGEGESITVEDSNLKFIQGDIKKNMMIVHIVKRYNTTPKSDDNPFGSVEYKESAIKPDSAGNTKYMSGDIINIAVDGLYSKDDIGSIMTINDSEVQLLSESVGGRIIIKVIDDLTIHGTDSPNVDNLINGDKDTQFDIITPNNLIENSKGQETSGNYQNLLNVAFDRYMRGEIPLKTATKHEQYGLLKTDERIERHLIPVKVGNSLLTNLLGYSSKYLTYLSPDKGNRNIVDGEVYFKVGHDSEFSGEIHLTENDETKNKILVRGVISLITPIDTKLPVELGEETLEVASNKNVPFIFIQDKSDVLKIKTTSDFTLEEVAVYELTEEESQMELSELDELFPFVKNFSGTATNYISNELGGYVKGKISVDEMTEKVLYSVEDTDTYVFSGGLIDIETLTKPVMVTLNPTLEELKAFTVDVMGHLVRELSLRHLSTFIPLSNEVGMYVMIEKEEFSVDNLSMSSEEVTVPNGSWFIPVGDSIINQYSNGQTRFTNALMTITRTKKVFNGQDNGPEIELHTESVKGFSIGDSLVVHSEEGTFIDSIVVTQHDKPVPGYLENKDDSRIVFTFDGNLPDNVLELEYTVVATGSGALDSIPKKINRVVVNGLEYKKSDILSQTIPTDDVFTTFRHMNKPVGSKFTIEDMDIVNTNGVLTTIDGDRMTTTGKLDGLQSTVQCITFDTLDVFKRQFGKLVEKDLMDLDHYVEIKVRTTPDVKVYIDESNELVEVEEGNYEGRLKLKEKTDTINLYILNEGEVDRVTTIDTVYVSLEYQVELEDDMYVPTSDMVHLNDIRLFGDGENIIPPFTSTSWVIDGNVDLFEDAPYKADVRRGNVSIKMSIEEYTVLAPDVVEGEYEVRFLDAVGDIIQRDTVKPQRKNKVVSPSTTTHVMLVCSSGLVKGISLCKNINNGFVPYHDRDTTLTNIPMNEHGNTAVFVELDEFGEKEIERTPLDQTKINSIGKQDGVVVEFDVEKGKTMKLEASFDVSMVKDNTFVDLNTSIDVPVDIVVNGNTITEPYLFTRNPKIKSMTSHDKVYVVMDSGGLWVIDEDSNLHRLLTDPTIEAVYNDGRNVIVKNSEGLQKLEEGELIEYETEIPEGYKYDMTSALNYGFLKEKDIEGDIVLTLHDKSVTITEKDVVVSHTDSKITTYQGDTVSVHTFGTSDTHTVTITKNISKVFNNGQLVICDDEFNMYDKDGNIMLKEFKGKDWDDVLVFGEVMYGVTDHKLFHGKYDGAKTTLVKFTCNDDNKLTFNIIPKDKATTMTVDQLSLKVLVDENEKYIKKNVIQVFDGTNSFKALFETQMNKSDDVVNITYEHDVLPVLEDETNVVILAEADSILASDIGDGVSHEVTSTSHYPQPLHRVGNYEGQLYGDVEFVDIPLAAESKHVNTMSEIQVNKDGFVSGYTRQYASVNVEKPLVGIYRYLVQHMGELKLMIVSQYKVSGVFATGTDKTTKVLLIPLNKYVKVTDTTKRKTIKENVSVQSTVDDVQGYLTSDGRFIATYN